MYYKTMTKYEYIVQEHECKTKPNALVDAKFVLRSYSLGDKPSRYYPGSKPDYDYDIYIKYENSSDWVKPNPKLEKELIELYEEIAFDDFLRQMYDNMI
jgi:hypothetical protein